MEDGAATNISGESLPLLPIAVRSLVTSAEDGASGGHPIGNDISSNYGSDNPFLVHRNNGLKRSSSYTDFHAEKHYQQFQQQDDDDRNHVFPLPLSLESLRHQQEAFSQRMESVFSSVRSYSSQEVEEDMNDSEFYLKSSVFEKAFPERYSALIVTLIFELPTLFMISGGSERLCSILGRKKYQHLVAFLPLASAISGNVGLQSSTLTTRAISHKHVLKSNYCHTWLIKEIGAALWLGLAMGMVIGTFAYIASEYDYAFGLTIAMAQIVSIITAGCTGTLAPIIFTYIFHQDSGKWGGPLETAIQDIVGSFAMVILSYYLLVFLGPHEVSPNDMCYSQ